MQAELNRDTRQYVVTPSTSLPESSGIIESAENPRKPD
jgi:hypothetical protein